MGVLLSIPVFSKFCYVKHGFLFILFYSFLNILNSQCPNESIILLTQSDIDNFSQQYPDCTYLESNLFIGAETLSFINPNCDNDEDPIIDLSGLDQLTYIRDTLLIQCNNSLTSTSGLNDLDSVGSIYISHNKELTDIEGFENLTNVTERLYIYRNENLNSIIGFKNMVTARNIYISADVTIDLNNLKYASAFALIGDIVMLHMDSIQTLSNLNVSTNNILENFDFLSGRELDIPQFTITQITQPFSFRGLEPLKSTKLNIFHVTNVDFSHLESLETMSGFRLSNCENCTSLSGLENIDFSNLIFISSNPFLTTLYGLSSLPGAIGSLVITGCAQLENIDALSGISSISNILEISNNASLNNCSIKPICRALSNDLNVLTIENNGPSNTCNTSGQILMGCTDKETYLDYTICDGDTIKLNNVDYTSVGLYYQDLVNDQGLDSILVIDIVASDDCSDPNADPDLCPLDEEKPGLQINKLSNDLYDIIITYKENNMTLEDIGHAEVVEIIACHKVCRDLTFDESNFSFIDHCDMIDDISRGADFDLPAGTGYDAMKYYTSMEEIQYFSEFIVRMAIEECVKI